MLLVNRGLCASRERAKRLILAGEVTADGKLITKPGSSVSSDVTISLKEKLRYVGRGGLKLERAIEVYQISVKDTICLDIGCSTGGFTDCLLQSGARKVFAIDVGTNQFAWKLRNDSRVQLREKFNARYLKETDLPDPIDICVVDVSFISLTKILEPALEVMKPGGDLICLIKPQFELERADVGKGGIVRDSALHRKAIEKIHQFANGLKYATWQDVVESPITGAEGNREFLAWIKRKR